MKNWCEIFRAGKYKDLEGKDFECSEKDLDKIIKNFNDSENPTVPNVVGHPKVNSPAYGWIEGLKREGEKLYAAFKQVPQEFKEAVNSGLFKNRSISLYPDLTLRHVGWLGAMPPRVKGMEEFTFSDNDEAVTLDFSDLDDFKFKTVADTFSRIRDFLIEKYDLETADRIIATWNLNTLKRIEDKTPEQVSSFCEEVAISEASKGAKMTKDLQGKNTPMPIILDEFAEEMKQEKEQNDKKIKELQCEMDKMSKKSRNVEHQNFAQQLVSNGNITPATASFVIDMLEIAHNQKTFDFSEGEEKSVKMRLEDFFKSLKFINFAQVAKEGEESRKAAIDFSDPVAASNAVRELVAQKAKDGISIDEIEAYNILKGNK